MTRLIDADALLGNLKEYGHFNEDDYIVSLVKDAPTVQREGWVSVPIEPTREMLEAAKLEQADHGSYDKWIDYGYGEDVIANYKAMIQAAPTDTE